MTDNASKHQAARDLLDEIVSMLQDSYSGRDSDPQIDSPQLVSLLNKNFERLDGDGNGIGRNELSIALARPGEFSTSEYTMLYLVGKYFDIIAELSDDEPGKQDTKITRIDRDILAQFLVHGKMNLAQLQHWFEIDSRKPSFPEPPPLTGK